MYQKRQVEMHRIQLFTHNQNTIIMPSNFYMYFVTALIPLIVGFAYYSPAVFGTAWMKVNNFTEEDLKGGNMVKILGLSYLLGILISFAMTGMVIHQNGVFQSMMPEVAESGSAMQVQFGELMTQFGDRFRTFGHGALHGLLAAVFFVLPIIGINALFERRGAKYTWIHFGYWAITLALVGGVLCKTLQYAPLS